MENDLEQQIAEFVLQRRHVAAGNRIGDLVGLLDCIRCDRCKILVPVPRAAVFGIAQPSHQLEQTVDGGNHARNLVMFRQPIPYFAAQARIEQYVNADGAT